MNKIKLRREKKTLVKIYTFISRLAPVFADAIIDVAFPSRLQIRNLVILATLLKRNAISGSRMLSTGPALSNKEGVCHAGYFRYFSSLSLVSDTIDPQNIEYTFYQYNIVYALFIVATFI